MARVLVTGSSGFIGQRVLTHLFERGHYPIPFDAPHSVLVPAALGQVDADVAIHLAADKHAPHGESYPELITELNVIGTANVCRAVPRVILASTCKAAAPITAYGASKLIAERIVLNASGTVMRLVNVVGSSGSVSEIWDALPQDMPLPVTLTERMYITPDQAVRLLVDAIDLDAGRYGPAVTELKSTGQLAQELHPDRPIQSVPLRNGDRPMERLLNDYEIAVPVDSNLVRIVDCWEAESDLALGEMVANLGQPVSGAESSALTRQAA